MGELSVLGYTVGPSILSESPSVLVAASADMGSGAFAAALLESVGRSTAGRLNAIGVPAELRAWSVTEWGGRLVLVQGYEDVETTAACIDKSHSEILGRLESSERDTDTLRQQADASFGGGLPRSVFQAARVAKIPVYHDRIHQAVVLGQGPWRNFVTSTGRSATLIRAPTEHDVPPSFCEQAGFRTCQPMTVGNVGWLPRMAERIGYPVEVQFVAKGAISQLVRLANPAELRSWLDRVGKTMHGARLSVALDGPPWTAQLRRGKIQSLQARGGGGEDEAVTILEALALDLPLDSGQVEMYWREGPAFTGWVIGRVRVDPGGAITLSPHLSGGAVLREFLQHQAGTRVPIVAVTGTNGKSTTVHLLAALLRGSHDRVGMKSTDGIQIGDREMPVGDVPSAHAARMILYHTGASVAVLETARGGLISDGAGYERCDIGVVLNVQNDHLGTRGIESLDDLARVKGVVAHTVRDGGLLIVNGDDPRTLEMGREASGVRVVIMTRRDLSRRDQGGGWGVGFVDDDHYRFRLGEAEWQVTRHLPLNLFGHADQLDHSILAAVAAALELGVEPWRIESVLLAFTSTQGHNPGRLNFYSTGEHIVVMDRADNTAALGAVMDVLDRVDATARTVIGSIPGDRRDSDIDGFARLCGRWDCVIVREPQHLARGRKPGAVFALFQTALEESGFEGQLYHEPDERRALERALTCTAADGLVLWITNQERVSRGCLFEVVENARLLPAQEIPIRR